MLDVVGARTQLRKAGARYTGRCPFHEERTPSFSVNAVDKLYYCFGCGAGGDLISFVKETENLDFSGAVEWLADRFRVELEYEEASPRVEAERRRRDRLGELLAAATAFYERCLWESAGAEDARAVPRRPRARRGDLPRVPARVRAGRADAGAEGPRARVHRRGAARRRARQPPRQRLLLAAHRLPARRRARPRARLPGAQAPRGRSAAGEVRQLAGERPASRRAPSSTGSTSPAAAIAKQDRAVVVEGNTDVIALRQEGLEPRRRVDGHRAHRPAPAAALAADAQRLALLRRRRGRRGGDAPRNGARGGAGVRDQGGHAAARTPTRPTSRPASSSASRLPSPISSTECGSRSTARADRQEAFVRVREILGTRRGLARPPGRRPPRCRPARPAGRPPGRARVPHARGDRARSRPRCSKRATGSSGTRSQACIAHPQLVTVARGARRRRHFDSERHRALRAHLVQGGEPPRSSCR